MARKEWVVEEMAYLVGDFKELDKKSLAGLSPMRVKIAYKDPKSIKGSSILHVNERF